MSLEEYEKKELVRLLAKIENTEIRGAIWHELVKKFISVAIEICILDAEGKFFMVYRKDSEFDGYHMPGSVVNDWETVEEARARLIQTEVMEDAGLNISEPEPIGWIDSPKDAGPAEPSPRHGVLLLHVARILEPSVPKEGAGFFSFDAMPANTLGCHKYLAPFYENYLKTGKPILGTKN